MIDLQHVLRVYVFACSGVISRIAAVGPMALQLIYGSMDVSKILGKKIGFANVL